MLSLLMMMQSNNLHFSNDIDLSNINLNNVNLVHDNFDNCRPKTINHARITACYHQFKQHKANKMKIDEELVHAAWYPIGWWDWCILEDEKKGKTISD